MITTAFRTDYHVYMPKAMSKSRKSAGLNLQQLLITVNDGSYVFEFGPHILIMLCFTIAAFRRIEPKMKKQYIFFLIVGIVSTFMATKYFPWKYIGNSFSIIQFPWRMLAISSFCFSFICCINLGIVIKKFSFKDAIILGTISIIYIISLKGLLPLQDKPIDNPKNLNVSLITGRKEDLLMN